MKTDRRSPSEEPPSKTTNSPPASSSSTPVQERRETSTRSGKTDRSPPSEQTPRGRCGKNVIPEGRPKQKDQTAPDVTYSTVSHIHTAGAARVQIDIREKTEYARIVTN
ncbi:hypothetical protein QTP86_015884 [Hemibagrus guttatus]|nr:hypothetical protein QTP86_015884 [Hemibagrus guttatus]